MLIVLIIISLLISSCNKNDYIADDEENFSLHLDVLESSDTALVWRVSIANDSDEPRLFLKPQPERGIMSHWHLLQIESYRNKVLAADDPLRLIDWIADDGTMSIRCGTHLLDSTNSIVIQPASVYTDTLMLPVQESLLRYMTGSAEIYLMLNYGNASMQTQLPYRIFHGTLVSNSQKINLGTVSSL